ncbi:MAG TPA: MXAN_5187 C-terminal domain-containing protein [Vicinamibacterales bacterium]|nr:MXAN_5187 C-terminal domain-containing protein [Vicinamibacterales bacterium]
MAASDTERDLVRLEGELKQLEAEYNMFFAGRLPRPPWETRARVEATVKKLDRSPIQNTGLRFRFATLQSRYATFIDLWDRGQRAREEGRPGPFAQAPRELKEKANAHETRVLHVAAFRDPSHEARKLEALYESLAAARREAGAAQVPFHKFAELVKTQVDKMKASGSNEVAFRVAVKDGKVNFTARALKGRSADDHARPGSGPGGHGERRTGDNNEP